MRLRFTIRDLLWLTLVVAVTMTWYLEWRRASALRHELEFIRPFGRGQNVLYDDDHVRGLPQTDRNRQYPLH
jgi:hypothetical protein